MKQEEEEQDRPDVMRATMLLPEGFAPGDVEQPDYGKILSDTSAPIVEQNIALIEAVRQAGFRPERALEYSQNGAMVYIIDFFDAVAQYVEGRVPGRVLKPMETSTEQLLDVLEDRAHAPMTALEVVRVAFHKANRFWNMHYARPRMSRKLYLKKLFAARDEIHQALEALHLAYVAASQEAGKTVSAKAKRRKSPASHRETDARRADDLRRIFQEIDSKRKLGWSVSRALQWMRQSDVWHARLGKKKDESIRRYYYARERRRTPT